MLKRSKKRTTIRNVDLNKHVDYDVIGKAKEFEKRVQAENPEFNLVWEELEYLRFSSFILQADEDGIRRYEELLQISSTGTLEERRKKVYIEWNSQVIWTHRTLLNWLDLYLGAKTYKLDIEYDSYSLTISVFTNNKNLNNKELADRLRQIIPANLTVDLRLLIVENLIFADSTKSYVQKFWMANEVPSGRIPHQTYKGILQRETLELSSSGKISYNRPKKTNEFVANNLPNKKGGANDTTGST